MKTTAQIKHLLRTGQSIENEGNNIELMAELLERAEDFVKDCKHNGENANAAEWLADFVKFQEQTLDNWLSHAKSRLEHNWAVTCVSPSDIIALIEELKELREFEAEMALRSRPK